MSDQPIRERIFQGREKRRLLAGLALLAPLPLPFSQVLEWPLLLGYALVLIYFIQRVERGIITHLSNWHLNLLGLIYIPLFLIDLRLAVVRGRFVIALIHLIMFLLLVKLYSMRREGEKWHVLAAIFFLFVGGMATSTHLTVSLYLVVFLACAMLVLARFAHLHVLAALEQRRSAGRLDGNFQSEGFLPGSGRAPVRLPLFVGSILVVLVAIPIFAGLPRLYEPFILGAGGGTGGLIRTTGFSDSVDLSLTSSIRGNRDIVLRVKYSDPDQAPDELRFKGAVYDRYEDQRWHRLLQFSRDLSPTQERVYPLPMAGSPIEPVATVEIFRERINSAALLVPMETLSVSLAQLPLDLGARLRLDPGGAAVLSRRPRETLRFTASVAEKPVIAAQLAELASSVDKAPEPLTALDQSGVTRSMRDLARRVLGEGKDSNRALRLERFLLSEFTYTTDFVGREGDNALEDFLFANKRGHCELFASAMVLMLRAEGIPARLSTGYLGAEYNPLEGYYMVRQENAHAWVEAFTENGWEVYDPTPPDGRPAVAEQNLALLLSQVWDYLNFRWDRYVLTYGAGDQADFFADLRERFAALWQSVVGDAVSNDESARLASAQGIVDRGQDKRFREDSLWQAGLSLATLFTLFALAAAAILIWHRRRPLTAEDAYRRLRDRLVAAGLDVHDALPPLELRELATRSFPVVERPVRRVVELYVRESFAGEALPATDTAGLRRELKTFDTNLAAWRKARKSEGRETTPMSEIAASEVAVPKVGTP